MYLTPYLLIFPYLSGHFSCPTFSMDLKTILPIIAVAILTLLGNVFYFEYKFRKERKKETLREKLTQFLLPLYFIFKKDEFELHEWIKADVDLDEYYSDMPRRLMSKELYEIISKNLYLADDELHQACLQFLEWRYKSDVEERL